MAEHHHAGIRRLVKAAVVGEGEGAAVGVANAVAVAGVGLAGQGVRPRSGAGGRWSWRGGRVSAPGSRGLVLAGALLAPGAKPADPGHREGLSPWFGWPKGEGQERARSHRS